MAYWKRKKKNLLNLFTNLEIIKKKKLKLVPPEMLQYRRKTNT